MMQEAIPRGKIVEELFATDRLQHLFFSLLCLVNDRGIFHGTSESRRIVSQRLAQIVNLLIGACLKLWLVLIEKQVLPFIIDKIFVGVAKKVHDSVTTQ